MKSAKTLFVFCLLGSVVLFNSCKEKNKHTGDTTPIVISGKQAYADSSSSSVKVYNDEGKVCIQQTNTYYELVDAYEGSTRIPLLLKIRKTELCYADSTNHKKVFEVTAKSILDSKPVNWQAQFVATGIEFKDNTLLATFWGGDNEDDMLTRFSLLNGKEVFSSSYGELKVAIPNVKEKRFIGYTSRRAVGNPIGNMGVENLLGVIRYGSSTGAINMFNVLLKRSAVSSKMPNTTPDMVLVGDNSNTAVIEDGKSIILMKADENYKRTDVKEFAIKFTIYYGDDNEATEIIIPVNNDQLNLAGAKYDKELFDIQEQ